MPKTNVLIVEDQRIIAKALEKRLEGMGYIVAGLAANGADGVRDALALRPDIVLMDISLGTGMDGIDAAEQVRNQADIPIVYLTAYSDPGTFERAKLTAPFGYILKPYDNKDLQMAIEIGLYRHRTEQKMRENEKRLLEANEVARAANAAKSEFLTNMSHEIRTPMTAILGFAELLANEERDSSNSGQKLEYIETIQRNGEHLLKVINDILDISKIEAEKVVLERLVVPLSEFLNDIVDTLKVKSKIKGIELSLDIGSDVPSYIETDPLRLRQVLVNLIGNAIKFTDQGSVAIRVRLDKHCDHLLISIVDTGIGLTSKQIDKMFGAFEQADPSTTRKYGGSGLGLRISKRFAELLGGDIFIESEFGRGSTFTLQLKKSSYQATSLASDNATSRTNEIGSSLHSSAKPLSGLRILLAEDGPDNQRLISHILQKAGAIVEIAENGQVAISKLTRDGTIDGELLRPQPFNLIVSDIQMPEIDGYSLAKILVAKGSRLPIIALTAHAMSDELQKCLNVGFDAYASKPIDSKSLIAICHTWGRIVN